MDNYLKRRGVNKLLTNDYDFSYVKIQRVIFAILNLFLTLIILINLIYILKNYIIIIINPIQYSNLSFVQSTQINQIYKNS